MNADFDPIESSIRRRAADVHATPPDFAYVLAHRQQRLRRRASAASVVMLAVGVAGLFALSSTGGSGPADVADGPADSGIPPVSDGRVLGFPPDAVWYCEDRVGHDQNPSSEGTVVATMPLPTTTAPAGFIPDDSVPPFSVPDPAAVLDSNSGFFRTCTSIDQFNGSPTTAIATVPIGTNFPAPTTTSIDGDLPVIVTRPAVTDDAGSVLSPVRTEQAYTVQAGDFPIGVAELFCVELDALLNYNDLESAALWPFPGEVLLIPPGGCGGPDGLATPTPPSTIDWPATTTTSLVPG